jgi:hypothetical protein
MMSSYNWTSVQDKLRQALCVMREFLYGMTTYGWAGSLRQQRSEVERLFMLITFGDLVGLPILPPYHTLRLLPYVIPAIHRWRRSLLRERDWTDLSELIEGLG